MVENQSSKLAGEGSDCPRLDDAEMEGEEFLPLFSLTCLYCRLSDASRTASLTQMPQRRCMMFSARDAPPSFLGAFFKDST